MPESYSISLVTSKSFLYVGSSQSGSTHITSEIPLCIIALAQSAQGYHCKYILHPSNDTPFAAAL